MAEPRVAIITGASGGIGAATAQRLAAEGWAVVLVSRNESRLNEIAERIDRHHATPTLVHAMDLTDSAGCEELVRRVDDRYGRIDAVANIAGFATLAPIAETTDQIWRLTMTTNVDAPFYLTRAAWPVFERQASGLVVNVSSMASIDPLPGLLAYATAKAAVNMLTQVLASEGSRIGVKAVGVAPGAVETSMLRSLFNEEAIPPERTISPNEAAETIAGCILGRTAFEPGQTLTLTR